MATPEQNTLLAMQLFGRPADEYAANNNQRLKVMLGIAQANREEQLRRDLATQQAQREDARYKSLNDREDARLKASDTRQAATIAAAERRQTEAQKEKERADLDNDFGRLYEQYVAAAVRAGGAVKQPADYPTGRAGLWKLAADLKTAEVGYVNRQLEISADAMIAEKEEKHNELTAGQKRLQELSKPSEQEEKIARSAAVNAVRAALENDPDRFGKPSKDAITKGINALAGGNRNIATKYLGEQALVDFESAYQQTLFSLPNTKAQLQEKTQTQQYLLAVQRDASKVDSDLRRAAATNPFLAERLKQSRLQQIMVNPPAEPTRRRTPEELFPAPQGGGGSGEIIPEPPAAPAKPMQPMSYKGGILGGLESLYKSETPERWAQVPGNIALAPLGALDAVGRYGSAGLQGLFTGDFSVPQTSVITPALTGLEQLFGATPRR